MTTYPDDDDGAVLAELASQGIDMSQPLLIDFPVTAPDEDSATAIAEALVSAGYDTEIVYDDGESEEEGEIDSDEEGFEPRWDVYAKVLMIPEYQEIMRIQAELDRLASPFGGKSDGWGVLVDGEAEEDLE